MAITRKIIGTKLFKHFGFDGNKVTSC